MNNQQQELELYSIKDLKIQKFLPPFFATSKDEALRVMREQVNYKQSLLSSFPEDYELYFLGSFSDFTAEISAENPQVVCNLASLKQDDTVKYDELLQETKKLQCQVDSSVMRFNSAMTDFHHSFENFLTICEARFKELYPDQKKNIVEKLFS